MIDALLLALPSPSYMIAGLAFTSSLAILSAMMTLVYLVTRVPNFAQGTLVICGSMVTLYLIDRVFYEYRAENSPLYLLLYATAPLVAGSVVALISLAEYVLVIRPLKNRGIGEVGLMISTLAFDAILAGSLALAVVLVPRANIERMIDLDIRSFDVVVATPLGFIYVADLLIPLVALVLALAMHVILYKTRFGIALRASIENPNLAKVFGIDVDRAYASAWLLAGFFSGVIGSLVGFQLSSNYGGLNPTRTQYLFLISIFAGSVLGGMSSIYLSMLGGFIIGFAESFLATFLNNFLLFSAGVNLRLHAYRGLFSFAAIMLVLLLAPRGLASIDWEKVLGSGKSRGGGLSEGSG